MNHTRPHRQSRLRAAGVYFLAALVFGMGSRGAQIDSGASIEGVVVRSGTDEPIAEAEVELIRVEGTAEAPLDRPSVPAARPNSSLPTVARGRGGANAVETADVRAPGDVLPHVRTTADGRFAFAGLKPGRYTLVAARKGSGYMPAEYGQRDPRGRGMAFPVAKGQAMRDIKIEMAPTGVITGHVIDENGEPMGHATVMALAPYYMKDGRRALSIIQSGQTGSRGEYRLFWLPPGRYYVVAKAGDLRRRTIPISIDEPGSVELRDVLSPPFIQQRVLPTGETVEETYSMAYFGGVTDADKAQPIELHPGESFGGADINLGAGRTAARHIRGVITLTRSLRGKTSEPAEVPNCEGTSLPLSLRAIPVQYSPDRVVSAAGCDANGAFDVAGVVPGKYTLWAVDRMTGGVGITEVEVRDADVNDVKIAVIAQLDGRGQIVFAGPPGPDPPDMSKLRVQLVPALRGSDNLGPRTATVKPNGEFSYALPSERLMRIAVEGLSQNTYVKSIRVGAADILSAGSVIPYGAEFEPIEITLAADVGAASGMAVDTRSTPLANVTVVIVPDSPETRATRPDLFKATATDENGVFRFQGIPAGHYRLFAWEYAQDNIWLDPEFLRDYEHFGTPLNVEGGRNTENLQIGAIAARR